MKFFKDLFKRFTGGKPVDWDELEETLIRADLGVPMTVQILKSLQARGRAVTEDDVTEVTREEILRILPKTVAPLRPLPAKPKVLLIVGVNGTGKTTSTAKLAHLLVSRRHSVMLAAADTFRAAAIEQLQLWADRLGVELVRSQYNGDPAALCHDAYQAAVRKNIEFLICDTAGRLHTKDNLMQELIKVKRVLAKLDAEAPHERWMVVDATTGSNGLVQTREFHRAIGLTGLIVTKVDGSGKGGSLVSIQQELGIPTRFLGTGEKAGDMKDFDAREFVEEML